MEDTRVGHDELVEIRKTVSQIVTEQQKILRDQNRLYESLLVLSRYCMWSFSNRPDGEARLKALALEK